MQPEESAWASLIKQKAVTDKTACIAHKNLHKSRNIWDPSLINTYPKVYSQKPKQTENQNKNTEQRPSRECLLLLGELETMVRAKFLL